MSSDKADRKPFRKLLKYRLTTISNAAEGAIEFLNNRFDEKFQTFSEENSVGVGDNTASRNLSKYEVKAEVPSFPE